MSKELIIVSSNQGKIKSLKKAVSGLDYIIKNVKIELIEPQFDTIEEVAEYKAIEAFKQLKAPLIVNDGGLNISALNGFPGVYTKYISETLSPEDFINLMYSKTDRSCFLTQCLIYVDQTGRLHKFQDKVLGTIATKVSSCTNERAWGVIWKIFIPDTSSRTLSELSEEEYYNKIRPCAQTNSVWIEFRKYLTEQNSLNVE